MSSESASPDWYEVLGVSSAATADEIKAAWRREIGQSHPDRNAHRRADATRRTQELNAAYAVLGNAERRAEYDASRHALEAILEAARRAQAERDARMEEARVRAEVLRAKSPKWNCADQSEYLKQEQATWQATLETRRKQLLFASRVAVVQWLVIAFAVVSLTGGVIKSRLSQAVSPAAPPPVVSTSAPPPTVETRPTPSPLSAKPAPAPASSKRPPAAPASEALRAEPFRSGAFDAREVRDPSEDFVRRVQRDVKP